MTAATEPRAVWNQFAPENPLPDRMPFSRDSALYRYTQALPFAFAVPYTAGLTVMHPGVAAGVDQHSSFRSEALRRALLTMDAATQLVSDRLDEVIAMAEHVRQFHTTVQGPYDDADGPPYAGARYGANDTRLQAWVIYCTQRGAEQSYERWVAPMDPDEKEALYRDVRTFGLAFGIPEHMLAVDRRALQDYADSVIDSEILTGTSTSIRVTRDAFRVPFLKGGPLALPARLVEAISVTFLDDPRLQEHFGLHPNKTDLRIARSFDFAMRSTWRHLPERLRLGVFPSYLAVRRRVRRARRRGPAQGRPVAPPGGG
jgi:uncharacterized protein (DUF2236 family)